MPIPLVTDVHCVCHVRTASVFRLDLLKRLLDSETFDQEHPLLIPRTKRGIQAAGEIILLGYPVHVEMIEDNHELVRGSKFLEVSDATFEWLSYRQPTLRFPFPVDLS